MECVAEAHEEGVTSPAEMVLDVGVGKPCTMEEVGHSHSNGMAGPRVEVGMATRDVEDLVGMQRLWPR